MSRQTLSFRALSLACLTAGLMPWAAHPFARGGQEIDVGPFEVVTDFPVHEELTAKETLPYLTAELSAVGVNGQREVIRFSANRITIIAQKNADTDNDQSPRLHFDDEELIGASKDISSARVKIVSLLKEESPDIAQVVVALGSALHTIQDFYSHSNWVELGNVDIVRQLGDDIAPQVFKAKDQIGPMCDFDPADLFDAFPFISLLAPPSGETSTGYWYGLNGIGQPVLSGMPLGKCPHGGFDPLSSGLNKDTDLRPRHAEARQLAKLASWNFVSKIIQDLEGNDAALCALMGNTTALGCQRRVSNVSVQPGYRQATVSWDPVPRATNYTIYFDTSPEVTPTTATGAVPVLGTPSVVTGLINGTTYYFIVTALVDGSETLPSEVETVTAGQAPTDLKAVPGNGLVSLSWSAVPDAIRYRLYTASSSGPWPEGDAVDVSGNQHVVTGLSGGTTYFFVVVAVYPAGDGPPSSEVSAVTLVDIPIAASGVASGDNHTCAIVSTGVKCWGSGTSGQLGNGCSWSGFSNVCDRDFFASPPVDVVGLPGGVKAITAARNFTCVIMNTGDVKCWGAIPYGTIFSPQSTPIDIGGLNSDVIAISAGYSSVCALTSLGQVKCWGYSNYPHAPATVEAVTVPDLNEPVTAIANGSGHTCAVTLARGLKCWGSNSRGQLGLGFGTSSSYPPVDAIVVTEPVTSVSVGFASTCIVTDSRDTKCWGYNRYGELGNGTTSGNSMPSNVVGLSGVTIALSVDGQSACAIVADGGLKCWGYNGYGQLGDGTLVNRAVPVDVMGLASGIAFVDGGFTHTCAVTVAGDVKCWGRNFYNEIGNNGPQGTQPTPVGVEF